MVAKKKVKISPFISLLFPLCIGLELLFYFLNGDMYFQLSGFFYFFAVAIIVGLYIIIKKRVKIPTNYTLIASVLFAVYLGISSLINGGNVERGYLITYLLIVLLIFVLEVGRLGKNHRSYIYAGYIGGAVIIALLQIIFKTRFYELESTRITIKVLSNDKIDPNYLAAFMIGPFFLSLCLMLKTRSFLRRLLLAIAALLVVIGIVFSGSRGAIVAIAVGILVSLLFGLKKKIKLRYIILIVAALITTVILAFVFIPAETFERFFGANYLADGSNMRRITLWGNALTAIRENPIFGYGARNTSLIIGDVVGDYEPAHNTFFDIWLQTGIFGVLFFIIIFARAFSNRSLIIKGLCIATAVSGFFIAAESCLFFWMNFLLAIYFVPNIKKPRLAKKPIPVPAVCDLPTADSSIDRPAGCEALI